MESVRRMRLQNVRKEGFSIRVKTDILLVLEN